MPSKKQQAPAIEYGWRVLETLAVPLERLIPHPENLRQVKTPAEDKSLADSLKTQGQLVPAIARVHPKAATKYELIAGCRRLRAAEKAGLAALRCEVTDATDEQALAFILNENLQRADLHPLDQAAAIERYMQLGKTLEDAAAAFSMSLCQAARRLQLLKLSGKWQKKLRSEASWLSLLTATHLEEIARLPADTQDGILEEFNYNVPNDISLKAWKQVIGNFMGSLAGAPWDPADESLNPKAGACATCKHRAGREDALFADMEFSNGSGNCLNLDCYEAKMQAWLERRMSEVREQTGEAPALLCPDNYSERLPCLQHRGQKVSKFIQNLPSQTFKSKSELVKAKQGEKGAFPAIRGDVSKPGELGWYKYKNAKDGQERKAAKEEAAEEKKGPTLKEKIAKLQARRHKFILDKAIDWLGELAIPSWEEDDKKFKPRDAEAWLAQFTFQTADCLAVAASYGMCFKRDSNHSKTFERYRKLRDCRYENERTVMASLAALFRARLVAHDLAAVPAAMGDFEDTAHFFRMPVQVWRTEAETEIPVPKSWGDNVKMSDKLIDNLVQDTPDTAGAPALPPAAAAELEQASRADTAAELEQPDAAEIQPVCPDCDCIHDGPDQRCADCQRDAELDELGDDGLGDLDDGPKAGRSRRRAPATHKAPRRKRSEAAART